MTVDVCGAHGTWFDPGELEALRVWFERKAAADDQDAARFRNTLAERELVDTAGELAGKQWLIRLLTRA